MMKKKIITEQELFDLEALKPVRHNCVVKLEPTGDYDKLVLYVNRKRKRAVWKKKNLIPSLLEKAAEHLILSFKFENNLAVKIEHYDNKHTKFHKRF
jgi:hypothetical protein